MKGSPEDPVPASPAALRVRERLQPETRRAQLLELGGRLVDQSRYEDFSLDELAALARVSKGLLYHYFPTKRELYLAVLRAATAEMLELVTLDPSLAPERALEAALHAYLGYVEQHSNAYRAVLHDGLGGDPEVLGVADAFRQAVARQILDGAAIEEPAPLLRTAVNGWIGMVEAASLDWLAHGDLERAPLIRLLADSLTSALELGSRS